MLYPLRWATKGCEEVELLLGASNPVNRYVYKILDLGECPEKSRFSPRWSILQGWRSREDGLVKVFLPLPSSSLPLVWPNPSPTPSHLHNLCYLPAHFITAEPQGSPDMGGYGGSLTRKGSVSFGRGYGRLKGQLSRIVAFLYALLLFFVRKNWNMDAQLHIIEKRYNDLDLFVENVEA